MLVKKKSVVKKYMGNGYDRLVKTQNKDGIRLKKKNDWTTEYSK